MVQAINSFQDFRTLINGDKPVVIDFWATWCEPCRMISPVFEKLEGEFPAIIFAKVDVDAQEEISAECGIRAMPTFIVFQNGNKIDEMRGADALKLQALLTRVASA